MEEAATVGEEVPKSLPLPPSAKNLKDQHFGRLTALAYVGKNKHKRCLWLCRCACGELKCFPVSSLSRVRSCGCARRERTIRRNSKHGESGTRLYRIWRGINARCTFQSATGYAYYGGRGISVCPEWRGSYEAFRDWAHANGYADNLTCERKNGNGDYEPSNCEWIPQSKQSANRSNNVMVSAFGETKSMVAWSKDPRCSVSYATLRCRLTYYGFDPEVAIAAPVVPGKKVTRHDHAALIKPEGVLTGIPGCRPRT